MIFKETVEKSNNFKFLEELVNSGKKEVELTSDIVLESSEELLYNEGIDIKTDGLIINGNGFLIDAKNKARIFRINGKNVTFKNITFNNALPRPTDSSIESVFNIMQGGALTAFESKLSFIHCSFNGNSCHRGGAIHLDYSECNIENCKFFGNDSNEFGGAIFNDELSSLTIKGSEFSNNISLKDGCSISSVESSLKVIDCTFSTVPMNNPQGIPSIYSAHSGNIVLKDSKFDKSDIATGCLTVIKDCDFINSTVDISNFGNLYCLENQEDNIPFDGDNIHYLNDDMDWVRELTEHELAREFLRCFHKCDNAEGNEQHELHDELHKFLEIWREIWPHESNFVMADVIVNVSKIDSKYVQDNLTNISKEGAIAQEVYGELHEILENVLASNNLLIKNFKDLKELIQSNNHNIILNFDVCLDKNEIEDYKNGIKIDVDDLVIDGQNHIIDAGGNASIFNIDAKDVTIKNIVFKNGFSNMGGAISNIGEVTFENCKFQDNTSSEIGGAIINDEKMIINNCEFESNSSGGVGGAISATFASDLKINDCKFSKNTASLDIDCPGNILPEKAQGFGGAIYNNGKLDINNSEFSDNLCDRSGGVMIVLPDSKINIESSKFKNNYAKADGGVIHNMGEINIHCSEFIDNSADNNSGVFDATESSILQISNSKFENNTAEEGNVIVNKGKLELIETQISDEDIVTKKRFEQKRNSDL